MGDEGINKHCFLDLCHRVKIQRLQRLELHVQEARSLLVKWPQLVMAVNALFIQQEKFLLEVRLESEGVSLCYLVLYGRKSIKCGQSFWLKRAEPANFRSRS